MRKLRRMQRALWSRTGLAWRFVWERRERLRRPARWPRRSRDRQCADSLHARTETTDRAGAAPFDAPELRLDDGVVLRFEPKDAYMTTRRRDHEAEG
jgi:hypothetical protein